MPGLTEHSWAEARTRGTTGTELPLLRCEWADPLAGVPYMWYIVVCLVLSGGGGHRYTRPMDSNLGVAVESCKARWSNKAEGGLHWVTSW